MTQGRVGSGVSAALSSDMDESVATVENPLEGTLTCMSISGWIRPANIPIVGTRSILETVVASGAIGTYQLSYQANAGAPEGLVPYPDGAHRVPEEVLSSAIGSGTWTWLALNIQDKGKPQGSVAQLIIDGAPVGLPVAALESPLPASATLHFGRRLAGVIDELRLSATCRSNLWMRAEYLSVEEPLPVFGAVQQIP